MVVQRGGWQIITLTRTKRVLVTSEENAKETPTSSSSSSSSSSQTFLNSFQDDSPPLPPGGSAKKPEARKRKRPAVVVRTPTLSLQEWRRSDDRYVVLRVICPMKAGVASLPTSIQNTEVRQAQRFLFTSIPLLQRGESGWGLEHRTERKKTGTGLRGVSERRGLLRRCCDASSTLR